LHFKKKLGTRCDRIQGRGCPIGRKTPGTTRQVTTQERFEALFCSKDLSMLAVLSAAQALPDAHFRRVRGRPSSLRAKQKPKSEPRHRFPEAGVHRSGSRRSQP
jgi:hypothetical protein